MKRQVWEVQLGREADGAEPSEDDQARMARFAGTAKRIAEAEELTKRAMLIVDSLDSQSEPCMIGARGLVASHMAGIVSNLGTLREHAELHAKALDPHTGRSDMQDFADAINGVLIQRG